MSRVAPGGRVAAATLAAMALAVLAAALRWPTVRAVAPELRTPLTWVPLAVTGPRSLGIARRFLVRTTTPDPRVRTETRELSSFGPAPGRAARGSEATTTVHVYRPAARTADGERRGALVWIHGGGTIIGTAAADHRWCSQVAAELDLVVVNVEYRLAPENPFPAALHDCYAALRWLHAEADALGVDRSRIAVGGASAGGGLAATLAQLAHDRAEVPVAFQLLVYPMLDDRTTRAPRRGPSVPGDRSGAEARRRARARGRSAWTPASNRFAWSAYLGGPPRAAAARPYAAAARRGSLAGLPPAWVGVGDVDLFLDEDVEYVTRLRAAGVPCELHLQPGMPHGADVAFEDAAPITREFRRHVRRALGDALARPDLTE